MLDGRPAIVTDASKLEESAKSDSRLAPSFVRSRGRPPPPRSSTSLIDCNSSCAYFFTHHDLVT